MTKAKRKNDIAIVRRPQWRLRILLMTMIVLIVAVSYLVLRPRNPFQHLRADAVADRDRLAYVNNDDQLWIYDPYADSETLLAENVADFRIAPTGRIVYKTLDDIERNRFYILDSTNPSSEPEVMTYDIAHPLRLQKWSPDGQYLVLTSFSDVEGYAIYIWDGESITNILPTDDGFDERGSLYLNWSPTNTLAIQFVDRSSSVTTSSTFLWDGNTMTQVNLGDREILSTWGDTGLSWSGDGRAIVFTNGADGAELYIWDGVSTSEIDSLIPIAPDWNPADATWLADGTIAFRMEIDALTHDEQIMIWDPETNTILNRIPVTSAYYFGRLTFDGTVILTSTLASGIPSIYIDVQALDGEILFSAHTGSAQWSSDGFLAYCNPNSGDNRGWTLEIWDGQDIILVTDNASYRPIYWQHSGGYLNCNNG